MAHFNLLAKRSESQDFSRIGVETDAISEWEIDLEAKKGMESWATTSGITLTTSS